MSVENKYVKDKNVVKLEIIVIIQGGAAHSICNLKYNVTKIITLASIIDLTTSIILSKKN